MYDGDEVVGSATITVARRAGAATSAPRTPRRARRRMTSPEHPWPAGAATGIGSLPGDDPTESARLVFDELPDLVFVPELPARGPGADLIGRTAALLVDLPVQLEPSGWRLAGRPGMDLRRARDLLARDLDAVEQVGEGFAGTLKVQVAGPITLAVVDRAAERPSRRLRPGRHP